MAFKILILILFLLIIGMIFYSLNKIREGADITPSKSKEEDEPPTSYKDADFISTVTNDGKEEIDAEGIYITMQNDEGNNFYFYLIDLEKYYNIKQSDSKQIFAKNCVKYGPSDINTIVVLGEENNYKAYYYKGDDFNPPIDPKLKELIPNLDSVKKKEIVYLEEEGFDLDMKLSEFLIEDNFNDKHICTIYLNEDCELIFKHPVRISYLVVGAGGNGGNVNNSVKIGGGGGGGGQIRVGLHNIEKANTPMTISLNEKYSKISTKNLVKVALTGFDGNIGFGGKAGGIKEDKDEDDGPYKNSNSMPSSVTGGGSGGESVTEGTMDYNGIICFYNCVLYKNNLNGGDGSGGYRWIDENVYGAGGGGGGGKGITPNKVIIRGYGGSGCRSSDGKDVAKDTRTIDANADITRLTADKEQKNRELMSANQLQEKNKIVLDLAEKNYRNLYIAKTRRENDNLRRLVDANSVKYEGMVTPDLASRLQLLSEYPDLLKWTNFSAYQNKMGNKGNLRTQLIFYVLDTVYKENVFNNSFDMDMYLLKDGDFNTKYNIETYKSTMNTKRLTYGEQQEKINVLESAIKKLEEDIKSQNDNILKYQAEFVSTRTPNRGNGGSTIFNSSDKLKKYSNSEEYGNENFLNGDNVVVNGLASGYFGCGGGGGASVFGYNTPNKSIGGKGSPGIVAIRIYRFDAPVESPSINRTNVYLDYKEDKDPDPEDPCTDDYYGVSSGLQFKCQNQKYLCNNTYCPGKFFCKCGICYPQGSIVPDCPPPPPPPPAPPAAAKPAPPAAKPASQSKGRDNAADFATGFVKAVTLGQVNI